MRRDMGGLFDIKHKLHGLSFLLGVPSLPIAALLIDSSDALSGQTLRIATHEPWISLILMGVSMAMMMAGFKKSGIAVGPGVTPPESVPAGVIALAGYANRLLILCYILWLIITASLFLA